VSPDRRWLLAWIASMIGFEALGFAAAFGLGWTIQALALRDAPPGSELSLAATLGLAASVGAVEGLSLATGQWLLLRRRLPMLRWRTWALMTAIGGALAWMLGMALGGRGPAEPSLWLLAVVFVLSGLVFGGLLGLFQYFELRRHIPRGSRWIAANAVGWMLGLAAVYGATALLDESSPLALVLPVAIGAGAVMAIAPALTTARELLRLVPSASA
jgi:hypothetical protein